MISDKKNKKNDTLNWLKNIIIDDKIKNKKIKEEMEKRAKKIINKYRLDDHIHRCYLN